MTVSEIKNLRIRQLLFLNVVLLFFLAAAYMLTRLIDFTISQMFLFIGIAALIQSIVGWTKRNSAKSIIPVMEQIAIYEKEKMGSEWEKQRKVSSQWSLFMSIMMFLNTYVQRDNGEMMKLDLPYLFFLAAGILVIINIGLIVHIRKVDGAQSKSDFKGFTLKQNLMAIVIGVLFGIIIFIFTIAYVRSLF
ncbi:hypothetical protein [Bacillus sp. J33]|uniref:hypothetical protein n=1 Tax=Bacillus sp. J33 TaxID=935836 RepID=UPI00047D4FB8|nr:hypothetical protein [Bacillus sp. J33]